ncbi:MAG: alkaline phosphatase D family protein [Opitutales bacterium]
MISKILRISLFSICSCAALADVHMANGLKVGEVDSTSAIVWTRLTENAERNIDGKPFTDKDGKTSKRPSVKKQPAYPDLEIMKGSVLGKTGDVRVTYWPSADVAQKQATAWKRVTSETDFIHQFQLVDLQPGTAYSLLVEGRDGGSNCQLEGGFRTAPAATVGDDIRFVVTTCGDYPRRDDDLNGHKIYTQMLGLDPDFFVHTGDIEYYDRPYPYAVNLELARFKWNRIYSMPFLRTFHNQVASYFIKDDHDTTKNDSWPGVGFQDLTWEQGLQTFREQVPMGEKTYRTIRWGKDLQVWLVEGRDFRSPNRKKDGPDKTIWGAEQKQWFFDTVQASDATFKVLISPTPIVGPDRDNKNDNHANKGFTYEGDQIRKFVSEQDNMYIVCGDRHWQYASIHPATGVREFSCGPASDIHAGGYREDFRNDMHRYLKVQGGFLRVDVDSAGQTIYFRHHAVDGSIANEESFAAK